MMPQLHAAARTERARRKAAWDKAGEARSDRASQDDRIWSNIEQMAGWFARDPACLDRVPWHWTGGERITMARSVWFTVVKMETALDMTVEANRASFAGMVALYRWLRPPSWSPHFDQKDFPGVIPPEVRKGRWIVQLKEAAA